MKYSKKEIKQQVEENNLYCQTCQTKRELKYFRRVRDKKGRYYFYHKVCRLCLSKTGRIYEKKVKEITYSLNKETEQFLNHLIKQKRGFVDMIDAYKLAHHHVLTFGYQDVNLTIEDDLLRMTKDLLNVYEKTIINRRTAIQMD